ncbi:MAG TPA: SIMPL domain-containing protein, partial [Blastocatellia bacterium]|nr:SIMPL domain-containing protein [Blastocatellia bacterium]
MDRRSTRNTVLSIVFVMCASAFSLAQERTENASRPTIRVSGDSTVTVKPDEAEINIGVLTQADTAQAAATQNAQKQDAVISELKKTLGSNADIKTIGYSVSPNYRYPKEGGQPTISGYTASNIVQVKTTNLPQVGKLIDLATQS